MKIFKIILITLFFNITYCQIHYVKVNYTTISNSQVIKSNLIFNNDCSIYKLLIDKKKDIAKVTKKDSLDNSNNDINININLDKNIPENFGLLTELKSNQIIDHKYIPKSINGKNYDTIFVKDKSRIIKWNIVNEYKKINNFNCQKAIGNFRGRTYHVWFTNDIPVSFGPWKLNGLPGLILEANDVKKQFYFYADKIEINKNKIEIDRTKFYNKTYISSKKEREIFISNLGKINDEFSTKFDAALPRGVNVTTKKGETIINLNDQIELNFDDIE